MHACAIEGAPVQATVAHAYACSRARVCVNACVCHVTRISTCAHASKDVRAHAPRPQSGLFPFSFPCRVNWDTTSTLPPMSRTERAHGFSSSPAHSRMLSSLRASHSTCSSVSSRPTPTSTAREGPLTAPTVSPSTDTDAYFWWWCVLGVGARDVSAVGTPRSRWSGCGRCNFRHRPRPRPRACEFLPLCACARARVHTRMACAWRVPVVSRTCVHRWTTARIARAGARRQHWIGGARSSRARSTGRARLAQRQRPAAARSAIGSRTGGPRKRTRSITSILSNFWRHNAHSNTHRAAV